MFKAMVNNGIKPYNYHILQVEIEFGLDRYCFQKSQGPFTPFGMFGIYPKTLEIMGISEPPNPTGSSQVFRATLASQVELVVGLIEVGASFFR